MMRHYTNEEIARANRVNLIDYCQSNGIKVVGKGDNPHLEDHDSLVFFPDNERRQWHRFSTGDGGTAIDFLMYYCDMSFPDAVQSLLDGNYREVKQNVKVRYNGTSKSREPFVSNITVADTFEHARNYLVEQRKIDSQLVDHLHKKGLIEEDNRRNVVFRWIDPFDTSKQVGANIQGTRKTPGRSYKQIERNSQYGYGFSIQAGSGEDLYVFESCVDMLSYITLNKDKLKDELSNGLFVSMEGLKPHVIDQTIAAAPPDHPIKRVFLGVDRDEAGHHFCSRIFDDIREEIMENHSFSSDDPVYARNQPPYGKDWNDALLMKDLSQEERNGWILKKYKGNLMTVKQFQDKLNLTGFAKEFVDTQLSTTHENIAQYSADVINGERPAYRPVTDPFQVSDEIYGQMGEIYIWKALAFEEKLGEPLLERNYARQQAKQAQKTGKYLKEEYYADIRVKDGGEYKEIYFSPQGQAPSPAMDEDMDIEM